MANKTGYKWGSVVIENRIVADKLSSFLRTNKIDYQCSAYDLSGSSIPFGYYFSVYYNAAVMALVDNWLAANN